MKKGYITQVIGPVVDIRFEGELPPINNAIKIPMDDRELVVEVSQHIGDNVVRCVAMASTDGLKRGMECIDTGSPIMVPVGKGTLGRMFNVLGQPIDELGEVEGVKYMSIHRKAPPFEEQSPATEILETGIKVIDLLTPYPKGGKIGLLVVQVLAKLS